MKAAVYAARAKALWTGFADLAAEASQSSAVQQKAAEGLADVKELLSRIQAAAEDLGGQHPMAKKFYHFVTGPILEWQMCWLEGKLVALRAMFEVSR